MFGTPSSQRGCISGWYFEAKGHDRRGRARPPALVNETRPPSEESAKKSRRDSCILKLLLKTAARDVAGLSSRVAWRPRTKRGCVRGGSLPKKTRTIVLVVFTTVLLYFTLHCQSTKKFKSEWSHARFSCGPHPIPPILLFRFSFSICLSIHQLWTPPPRIRRAFYHPDPSSVVNARGGRMFWALAKVSSFIAGLELNKPDLCRYVSAETRVVRMGWRLRATHTALPFIAKCEQPPTIISSKSLWIERQISSKVRSIK
jgi:hypothetical protein